MTKGETQTNLHKGRMILYIICGLILLLASSLMIFRMGLSSKLNGKLDKIRAAGYPATLAEVNDYYPAVSDDENAALVYEKAFSLYHKLDDTIFKQDNKKHVEENKQLKTAEDLVIFVGSKAPAPMLGERLDKATKVASQKFLDTNRECIAMLKQADKLLQCRFPIDLTRGYLVQFPHLSKLRSSIELLALATVLAAENKDTKQAMGNIMTMLNICQALSDEPIIYSYLLNTSLQSTTINVIEYTINIIEFDEQSLKTIGQRLKSFMDSSDKVQERVLATDRVMIIDFESLVGACEYENILNSPYSIAKFIGITTLNKIKLLEISQELLKLNKNNITAIKKYELEKKQQLAKLPLVYFLTKQIMADPNAVIYKTIALKAKLKVAIIGIAIERYQLKYRKLPEQLTQLVPEFIQQLPNDPFSRNPFHYVVGDIELIIDKKYKTGYSDSYKHREMCYLDGGRVVCLKRPGWVVYSIGQDLKDDKGIPVGIKNYNIGDIPFRCVRK